MATPRAPWHAARSARPMATLPNPHDHDESAARRAAQEDPWVMYLVVRQEAPARRDEVFAAAAQGTMRCVDALADQPAWAEAFAAWGAQSFRKVSLRAREPAWARLAEYDAGVGELRGESLVRVL